MIEIFERMIEIFERMIEIFKLKTHLKISIICSDSLVLTLFVSAWRWHMV